MSFISFEQIRVFLIGALLIAVLVAIAIGASLLSKKDIDDDTDGGALQRALTPEEKIKILEDLSTGSAGELTDEEKKAVLESLSAPEGSGTLTDEEKIQILENL